MSATYTIAVTKSQLETLSLATEILSRLATGQFPFALEHLPFKPGCHLGYDTIQYISEHIAPYLLHNVNGWNSSLGIGNEEVADEARIAWDLHQAFRHRLAWERAVEQGIVESLDSQRKWPEMMGVHYDEPFHISKEPLPIFNQNQGKSNV